MLEKIQESRERLAGYLRPTPAVGSEFLSRKTGSRVWLKLELLQPTSSFKVRPALNDMLTYLSQARRCGVVASSSGNFAQGVAYAARLLDVDAQVVMMRSASPFKIRRTEQWGATVVPCSDDFQDRWDTTFRIQEESGRVLLHAYDSEETIAGDGTIGLELVEQIEADFCVLVPVSGGGLIAGIASAVKALRPGCRVIGIQPAANASMARSLKEGRRVTVTPGRSLADALAVATPGERTFAIVRKLVDDVVLVEEEEIAAAVRTLAVEQKLVVEGGGAVGVAALMAGKVKAAGLDVVCVLSGGNILPEKFAQLMVGSG